MECFRLVKITKIASGLIETADKAAHIALELKRVRGKSVSENNVLSKADLQKNL